MVIRAGFIGAGGIAHSHVYALQALKFYYRDVPEIMLESVCSLRQPSRDTFAERYRFNRSQNLEDFIKNNEINSVFILGPNSTHFEHLKLVITMPGVDRIYIEKPVCASLEEEVAMNTLPNLSGKTIQVGFQFLLAPAIRGALSLWKSGSLGKPIHFDLKYYHGDYLQENYRMKRQSRLTPAPDGGAMADLGCHGVSLLMAFLGEDLKLTGALQGGGFPGVPEGSDLFSQISLFEPLSKAVGTLSASRVSSGSGDLVRLEIWSEKGTIRYSSENPDSFSYSLEGENREITQKVGGNYLPVTSFPAGHVSPGWLRALVHAHYLFTGGSDPEAFIPGIGHGLAVQRVVRETASCLETFRKNYLQS